MGGYRVSTSTDSIPVDEWEVNPSLKDRTYLNIWRSIADIPQPYKSNAIYFVRNEVQGEYDMMILEANGVDFVTYNPVAIQNATEVIRQATQSLRDETEVFRDEVEADKNTVAADKSETLGYKNAAETAKTQAETARDLAITNAALAGNTRIQDWTAQSYVALSQVVKDGIWWVLPTGISAVSTDVPGVSSKWVQRAKYLSMGGYNPITNTPVLSATPNSALLDESFYIVDTTGCVSFIGDNFVAGFMFQRGDRLIKRGASWVVDTNDRDIINGVSVAATSSFPDKYYQYDTGVEGTLSGYTTYKFPVLDSKKYIISADMIGNITALSVFLGASNNYLGYQDRATISGQTYKFINRKLTLPTGTAFVLVSIKNTNFLSLSLKEITSTISVRDTVIANNSEIVSVKATQVANSAKLTVLNSTFASIVDEVGYSNFDNSYYDKTTGVKGTLSGYYSRLYPYNNIDLFVSTKFQGNILAAAVFFDSGMAFLGNQLPNSVSGVTIVHDLVKIVPPTGTAFIGVTSRKVDLAVPKISKYGDIPSLKNLVASVFASPLYNKVIGGCGDSIHEGTLVSAISDSFAPISGSSFKNYLYYIAKRTGAKWHNYGISGSTLGDIFCEGADRNGFSKAGGRYTTMADGLDYIPIMFGTNDGPYGQRMVTEAWVQATYGSYKKFPRTNDLKDTAGYMTTAEYNAAFARSGTVGGVTYSNTPNWELDTKTYIGTIDDTTNKTWYGAWNIVLPYLINKYPTAKILIWLNPTSNTFDDATIAICKKWGIPWVDLSDDNMPLIWRKRNATTGLVGGTTISTFRKNIYTSDGTHPNDAGYEFLSTIMENALLRI